MKNLKLFVIVLFLIGIQSCKDSKNSTEPVVPVDNNFVYPVKIGNSWNYNSSIVYSNFRPDSVKDMLENTSTNVQITITKDTTLNSIKVYEMKEESNRYPDSFSYYANQKEGFIGYAYSNNPSIGLPKTKAGIKFLFKGRYYNSIIELIKKQEEVISLAKKSNDSLIYYDSPRVIFEYPLEIGKKWLFSSSVIIINKNVISKEPVKVNSTVYECYKIQWEYDINSDGIVDDDIIYYEYVSSKGLIKTEITFKDVVLASMDNPDGIGFADIREERVLTGVNF